MSAAGRAPAGRSSAPIAVFLPGLRGGGAERAMTMLCNLMVRRGRRVHVVVSGAPEPPATPLLPGIEVTALGQPGVARALVPLARRLAEIAPDCLLSAQAHANTVAVAARALSRADPALVLAERSSLAAFHQPDTSRKERLIFLAMPPAYRRADTVVALGERMADELVAQCGVPRGRIAIIPNAVDIDRLARERAVPLPPEAIPPEGTRLVVTAGRLAPQKDHATLLRAIAAMPDAPRVRLLVLGNGEEDARLRALAADLGIAGRVVFAGAVPSIVPYLDRADAFALSSRWEGHANVLLEALALGVPTVSTDHPVGARETLARAPDARLVPVADHRALAAALTETLRAPRRMRPAAPIAPDYTCEDMADRYLAAIDAAVARRRARGPWRGRRAGRL